MNFKINKHLIIFILVLMFFVVNHFLYLSRHTVYISGDQHQYVDIAVQYLRIFQNPSIDMVWQMLDAAAHRPPVYPLLVSVSYAIFGLKNPTLFGAGVNAIYLVILGASIYGIGLHFFRSHLISLVSVVVGLSYPIQVILSHQVMTEVPLTAMIAMTCLFLLKSKNLKDDKYLLLASISFGFALLTRFTAGFFIFGPALYLVYIYFKKHGTKRLFAKFYLPVLFGIVLPILYYLYNFTPFIKYVNSNRIHGPSWSPHERLSFESMLWYPLDLGEVLSLYLWAIFLVGFVFALLNWKKYAFLLLWLLSAYLVFTFIVPFKSDRFIMPIYPALAVISMIPLTTIKTKTNLMFASSALIVLAVSVYMYTSWNMGPFREITPRNFSFFKKRINFSTLPYTRSPNLSIYKPEKIIQVLDKDVEINNINRPRVLFTISIEDINKVIYQHIRYETLQYWSYEVLVGQDKVYYENLLLETDYVIAKEGETIDGHHPIDRVEKIPEFNAEFLELVENTDEFRKIAEEEFQDGSLIYLYKRVQRDNEPVISI